MRQLLFFAIACIILFSSVLSLSAAIQPQYAFAWGGGGGGGGGGGSSGGGGGGGSTTFYSIAASEGKIFVSALNQNKIKVYPFWSSGSVYENKNMITEFGELGLKDGKFVHPMGIDVSDGKIFVTDSGNNRIQVFDFDGNFVSTFGSKGSADGKFKCPHDIKIYKNKIYVADSDNYRIQVFDFDGNFVSTFGSRDKFDSQPYKLDVFNDKIYVVEIGKNRIQVFNLGGDFLFKFGKKGEDVGELRSPSDIAVSGEKIFVADTKNSRVQVFDINGNFLTTIGSSVAYEGFSRPHSLAILDDKIFVGDRVSFHIQVFEIPDLFSIETSAMPEYEQTALISDKSLGVGFYTVPETPNINGVTDLEINFLKSDMQTIQEHVDYQVHVSKDGNDVFGPISLTHTSRGSVTIPVQFTENGLHKIDVTVGGFLFKPIPSEVVSFTINMGYVNIQPEETSIPGWIRNNAGWWASDQIPDSAFLEGIQYLIKEGIIVIPPTETSESSVDPDAIPDAGQRAKAFDQQIPSWIKNNAGWWADGQIDDNAFVSGIQYLVKVGIIKV